ncbi:hypothetical protein B0T17DRAFT_535294, partial [Bombardia bombarda]
MTVTASGRNCTNIAYPKIMQPNKERQRKIRNELHRSFPKAGSPELELWEQNQTSSPLLKLPAELRNKIYNLVLSVGQINVCHKRWAHRAHTRPGTTQRYYETIEGGFWCRILPAEVDPWRPSQTAILPPRASHSSRLAIDHYPPVEPPPRGMTLLSPVCRQLYHETALLPYALNAWSFESTWVMDRYVMKEKRLPMPQRRAIRILYSQQVLTAAVEKFFGGLEVILLSGGTKMTKHVIESDPESAGRRTVMWEVEPYRWK